MKRYLAAFSAVLLATLAWSCSSGDDGTDEGTLGIGLVVHYLLDGDARDAGPSRVDGAVFGAQPAADRGGAPGGAMAFDGVDDRIVMPRQHFAAGNDLSVALWVKTSDLGATSYFVMCSDFGVFSSGGALGLAISLPATDSAKAPVAAGTWNHFVGTYDGTTIRVYLNGLPVAVKTHAGDISDPGRDLTFGLFGGNYWAGVLDDVRIYDRPLSPDEVQRLFHL